jgi:uncharacterized protein (TIGR00369 family)
MPDAPPAFPPRDPHFEQRVRESFARQASMATLGARLAGVAPGEVVVELVPRPELTQQNGYVHAGVAASIADSACGYAAYTLMPADSDVLSVEFKVNLVAPAAGDLLVARGRVERAGRTLTVCRGEVVARSAGEERTVLLMQATMMRVDSSR